MKVLFVCTGNTCRSPMLENMFRKYLQDEGIENIQVNSAGLMAHDEPTNAMCSAVLKKHGVPHAIKTAKTIDKALFFDCDIILTMTDEHAKIIDKTFGMGKTYSLSSLFDVDIFDPYGEDERAYEQVYQIFANLLKPILNFVNSTLQVAI